MVYSPQRDIDMTPAGGFRTPVRPPLSTRIIAYAVVVAVVAGAAAFAALAFWLALVLIPVALFAVLVIVLTVRFKIWRARKDTGQAGPLTRQSR